MVLGSLFFSLLVEGIFSHRIRFFTKSKISFANRFEIVKDTKAEALPSGNAFCIFVKGTDL